jgi:tetratricopeptide (TPR) repeat protein
MSGRSEATHDGREGLARLGLAMLLVASCASLPAWAHRGHGFGNPFHAVSLQEACQLARDESKLVFVFVTEPRGSAFAYLERPTWVDWRAIDLLIRETVAVKLESQLNAAELKRYEIKQYPTMMLLNPDGSCRKQFAGELTPKQLMEALATDLSGEDSLARVRQAIEKTDGEDPFTRERLAQALARCGQYDQALKEYLWCLEVALRRNIPYAAARRRLLLKSFVSLAEQYPPARVALLERRDAMEQALRGEEDSANLARDLVELNCCLDEEQRNLALYDALPARSKARQVLFDRVIDQLIEQQRYAEILAMLDPLRAFSQEVRLARIRGGSNERGPEAARQRGTRAFAVTRGAALVEALAGAGRTQEARTLIKAILNYDDTPETQALLKRHADRVNLETPFD